MQIVSIARMSNPVFLVIKKKKFFFLSSAELAQIVVIRYPRAPSVVSLSKTLCPRNLLLVLTRKTLLRISARAYDNIMDKCHFGDSFPPMLGLYMCLFYWFNKLRSWFCINVEDTKTEHLVKRRTRDRELPGSTPL